MSGLNYSQTIYLFQESDLFLMHCGHLWRFINNSGPPFSLTNEEAHSMCGANKTCVRGTSAKSQQGECVTWHYHAAKITHKKNKTTTTTRRIKRKSARLQGSCQLQGCAQMEVCEYEEKARSMGLVWAKSSYLLSRAFSAQRARVCPLLCFTEPRCMMQWWCWVWGVDLSSARHIY